MAISQDLKEIYSNYQDDRQYYDTVQLYHPNFKTQDLTNDPYPRVDQYPSTTLYPSIIDKAAQSYFMVRNDQDMTFELEPLINQVYRSYPFDIIQPEVGADQQDIGVVFDNVSLEIIQQIELAAENPAVPIQMTFRVYMDGAPETQITPIELSLTEIIVDMSVITCKASRVDLYKRKFPFGDNTYYNHNFAGLLV